MTATVGSERRAVAKPTRGAAETEGLRHVHELYRLSRLATNNNPTPANLAEERRLHLAYVCAIDGQLPEGAPNRRAACGLSKTKADFCLMGGFH